MEFNCVRYNKRTRREIDKWTGRITGFEAFGTHYEMRINSRSGILVIFGRCTSGWFASIPDWKAGCYLADLSNVSYNTERLENSMRNVIDAITVAKALAVIAPKIHEIENRAS